jgi:hypothetical protein
MNSRAMKISFWLYALATLASLLIGLLYASRSQIMPYHLEALETTWDGLGPSYQVLLKALLNGGGFYGIANGLFMLMLLLIPFRKGEAWAGYSIGLIGLAGAVPLTYIVYTVKTNTAGNPPLSVMVIVVGLMIAGLLSFIIGQNVRQK